MLHGFFDDLKGWHVQYNIVDRETLLQTQTHPEKYRDLIVRVDGYSAFLHTFHRTLRLILLQELNRLFREI